MKRHPQKDLEDAVRRLRAAADANGLMAYGGFKYRGAIAADLRIVLAALERPATVVKQ